jgi:hypothetical protein
MWEDPIVAEVHRAREMLAAECNFDIAAFFANLRKRQAARKARLVHEKERTDTTIKAERECHSGTSEVTSSEAAPAT